MEKVKIAICGACLVIVAILGYCYISEKQNEKYEYIVNSAISNIVDTVIEKYPDVREEEILNILRNTKNNKTNILKKYGYLDNENYIKKLEDVIGFDLLDEKLQEVIIYRKKYPDVSLNDLSIIMTEETNKTITKSGLNHRFRKIQEMAKKLDDK